MKIIFVDPNPDFKTAVEEFFKDLPDIEAVTKRFEQLPEFDCMVSPANSFGLMDGGVDAAITDFFGYSLVKAVQKRIIDEYWGEQPVGTCMIVETGHYKHPFLAHTPTMRVPMKVAHTDNVYKAMWALLLALHHHNQSSEYKINTVACPGLGTGYGRVPFREAARQMALAYRNSLNPPARIDWRYAGDRQEEIRYGGDDGLDFPPEP